MIEEKLKSENSKPAEIEVQTSKPKKPVSNNKDNFIFFKSQIVTAINSWLTFFFGIYYAIKYGFPIRGDQWNNSFETIFSTIQIGYFVYDFLLGRYHKTDDLMFIMHHSMATIGYMTPFLFSRFGNFAMWGMFTTEISAPFLSNRGILPYMDNVV